MNGSRPPPNHIRAQTEQPVSETSLVVSQRLVVLVNALNLLRINLGMYPPGHTRIREATDQAYEQVQKSLRGRADLTFIIDKNTLISGGIPLDPNNSAVRDYARILEAFHLVSFSFLAGVKKADLTEFHHFLSQKPADLWEQGTVDQALSRAGVRGIRVRSLEADDFQVTEEREIFFGREDKESKKSNFWLDFLARSREIAQTTGNVALSPFLDPSFQARTINERRELWQRASDHYEQLVREYFLDIRHGKRVTPEKTEALASISDMLESLHPELKGQLLDAIERQVCLQPESLLVPENLKCFPRELFMQMVQIAQERKTRISPTLILLMQKMATVHRQEQMAGIKGKEEDVPVGNVRDLIRREDYEKYVPREYEDLLRDAAESPPEAPSSEEIFPIQEFMATLQEDQIQQRITHFSVVMMEEDVSLDEYRMLSQHLVSTAMKLIEAGQFAFLTDILQILQSHARTKPSEAVRQRAQWALNAFTNRDLMVPLMLPHLKAGKNNTETMGAFLLACGDESLAWLFDLYLDPSFSLPPSFLDIINGFGTAAGDEAYRRLRRESPQGISRLMTFIREKAHYNVTSELMELYNHGSRDMKKEVLETLLQFQDPLAKELLLGMLKGDDWEERLEAVHLLCRHRLWDLMDDVLGLIHTFLISREDAVHYERIIREIAATGDPATVPHLKKLTGVRWTLSPRRLLRMKHLIQQVLFST